MIMEMDDSNQELLKEIPLYFTKELLEELILLQYPVRPAHMNYNECHVTEVLAKPDQKKLEISMVRNRFAPSYDLSRGEQMAINTDGLKCEKEESYFKSGFVDKHTLSSCVALDGESLRYAAACFQNNVCVLCPVDSILHMRPSFNYLDKRDKKEDSTNQLSDLDSEFDDLKAVTVKFAKRDVGAYRSKKETSFNLQANKASAEKWISLSYNGETCEEHQDIMGKLINHSEEETKQLKMAKEDYIKHLICDTVGYSEIQGKGSVSNPKMSELFMRAQALTYSQLARYFPQSDPKALLHAAQQLAVTIQGNWVVKSEVLYPKEGVAGITGTPSEAMIKGRDQLLLAFHNGEHVDRHIITATTKLPSEEIEEILRHLAILTPEKRWKFKLDLDGDFIKKFPEVHQRQEMLWESKKQVQVATKSGKPAKGRRKSK